MARRPKKASWPPDDTAASAPDWYVDTVFRNALRRVVCVLNQRGDFTAAAGVDLSGSDDDIARSFEARELDAKLIQFNIEGYDVYAASAEHHAEHHFYANVGFPARGAFRVAVFKVPRVFLDWGYQNLRRPAADPLIGTDFAGGQADPLYIKHCATNYLVKNFWHNFVHSEIQGINQSNYGAFRGLAREDSDFDADHIANLLTLRSYGVRLHHLGRPAAAYARRVNAIFTRNRCNLLFAKRARHREEDASAATAEERWTELEWRFIRGVSNRVSTALLERRLAVPSLRVFLGGDVRNGSRKGTPTRWRRGNVLVDVAGRRLATPYPAYVPDDEWRAFGTAIAVADQRYADMRRKRSEREQEIANWVAGEYRQLIGANKALRDSVRESLEAIEARISVDLLA